MNLYRKRTVMLITPCVVAWAIAIGIYRLVVHMSPVAAVLRVLSPQ
jgi:hypothetical protein